MMRTLTLLSVLLGIGLTAFSQKTPIQLKVEAAKSSGAKFQAVSIFQKADNSVGFRPAQQVLQRGSLLQISGDELSKLHRAEPEHLVLTVPTGNAGDLELELVQYELFTDDFKVTTNETGDDEVDWTPGVYYRGIVKGSKKSFAAVSIFKNDVIGVIESEELGNLVLGKVENDNQQRYILYNEADLDIEKQFSCDVLHPNFSKEDIQNLKNKQEFGEKVLTTKCVRAFLECEYDLQVEKGGLSGTATFMTGLFNVVSALYQNETITMQMSQLLVWTTPDSYANTSTSNALTSFRTGRPTFNGDIAHLVSRGAPTGGGIAWMDVLCTSYAYGYSYIYSSYSQLPTYSWSVNVITHEMGHNLGSPHTHDCSWNGNSTAIDGCGPAAGYNSGCNASLPSNGGTIMSYCHLLSSVGINFNNGFGTQPGNLIRTEITNATCLTSCGNCPALALSKTDLSCYGANNGNASVVLTGGTPPFNYNWSNNAHTASISGLAAGTYTVTVTDASSCSLTGTVTITQPSAIVLTTTVTKASAPEANDGAIDLTVSGGSSPYTYDWSNNETTQDISGLTPGTYTVTVTDNKNCTNPTSVAVTYDVPCPTISVTKTDVVCFGGNTGSVTAVGSGGLTPYTYLWSNNATTQTLSNLSAGTFSVTMTDAAGCSVSGTATLTQPTEIIATVSKVNSATLTSNDGSLDLTVSGGTAPYSYNWSNGPTVQDLTGLAPGTYTVTVTDNQGCVKTAFATIQANSTANCATLITNLPYTESFETGTGSWVQETIDNFDWTRRTGKVPTTKTGPTAAQNGAYYMYTESTGNVPAKKAMLTSACFDFTNWKTPSLRFWYNMYGQYMGTLEVQVSIDGGTTFTKIWSVTGNQNTAWKEAVISLTAYEGKTIKIRFVGTTGKSDTSDMAIDNITVNGVVPPCSAPVLTTTSTSATCYGIPNGSASVSATGGVPPYTYAWSNGATTASITNVTAGSYTVTVTGSNNCKISATIAVQQPAALTLTTTLKYTSSSTAADGSIDLTVTGGTAPYVYEWSNGATTQDIKDLAIGQYMVTVTDNKNCNATKSSSIQVMPPCSPVATVPYYDGFETTTTLWTQATDDNMNWTRYGSRSPTSGTGVSAAADGKYYYYTESNANWGKKAALISPCFNLINANNPTFSYSYAMYGSNMGNCALQVSTDGGATWEATNLWYKAGDQGSGWKTATINLGAYIGKVIKLRFLVTIGNGDKSDVCIDKLSFSQSGTLPPIVETVGPIEDDNEDFVSVYPNPVSDFLNIEITSEEDTEMEIHVNNLSGQMVLNTQHAVLAGQNQTGIDVSGLERGIYYLMVSDGKSVQTKRFMVIR